MEATSTGAKEPNHLHGKKVKYVSRNVKKKTEFIGIELGEGGCGRDVINPQ